MRIQQEPTKAVVSVVEMADMVGLSKSRFYTLMDDGVFPGPVQNAATKRPVFDFDTQKKVLDVRNSGISVDGRPVLFNRKLSKNRKPAKSRNRTSDSTSYDELIAALKSLGLTATYQAVAQAVTELFPNGIDDGQDEGDVIRAVFLHLQMKGTGK